MAMPERENIKIVSIGWKIMKKKPEFHGSDLEKIADFVVYVPKTNRFFTNTLAIIPLQLFSYYISLGKGLDVDKPRNLAKSVTVE